MVVRSVGRRSKANSARRRAALGDELGAISIEQVAAVAEDLVRSEAATEGPGASMYGPANPSGM